MSETAKQLINIQYRALFVGVDASEKSAVEKLQAISDCVNASNELYILEGEERKKLREKEFSEFLTKLAEASDADLEIFKKMMQVARDRNVFFLKIATNQFFQNDENVKKFLDAILENKWIDYSTLRHLATQTENMRFSSMPVSLKADVVSSYPSVPPNSPVKSVRFTSIVEGPQIKNVYESHKNEELKNGTNQIISRLTDYLKMREKNPGDEKSNVNIFRNVFHNKNLTKEKVNDARALIKILKESGVSAFLNKLNNSIEKNENAERREHIYTFWKTSGGEYGKCLRDCLGIATSEKLELLQFKENMIEKINNLPVDMGVDKKKLIEGISKAETIESAKAFLGRTLSENSAVLTALNPHRAVKNASMQRPGALKVSD